MASMDKKDIYEHLAKIYLDASNNKKKKPQEQLRFKRLFVIFLVSTLSLTAILTYYFVRNKSLHSEVALVLQSEVIKINFNFDPAKKEIYSIPLKKLNASKYKHLGFALKKENFNDRISLKIELTNVFNEKSEIYAKDIPHKWRDYKINFSDFKNITDWSSLTNLSFIVEEWNSREKSGIIYIDNVRFIK